MDTRTHTAGATNVVELVSDDVLISTTEDALAIIWEVPSDHIVLHEHNFASDFFDLSTRKLGEVLLKFGNYRVSLAVVGDFAKYPSRSLAAFIHETNRQGDFLFVSSIDEVMRRWR